MTTNTTIPILAAENDSAKEEIVYIMSNADGTVKNINVVNIFDGGNISDYGDYSSVKILNTTDKLIKKEIKLLFHLQLKKYTIKVH